MREGLQCVFDCKKMSKKHQKTRSLSLQEAAIMSFCKGGRLDSF
jgi:hypothetical protein